MQKMLADSVFSIGEVTVSSKRLNQFNSGLNIRKIDSTTMVRYALSDLSRLLSATGSGQVNTYGPGAGSISSRGTTSSHTAVLWNGINLQDMFNGGCDISQIQVGFIDEVSIQSGGNSALFGSGAIGGVIHLNNIPDYNQGLNYNLKTGIGSYGSKYYGANASYSDQRFYQVVKAYRHTARNNYPFRSQNGTDTLNNAGREQFGIMVGLGIKQVLKGEFDIYFWNQNNSQDIMSVTTSTDHQSDNRNMLNAGWKYSIGNTTFAIRTGINYHILYYNYSGKYTTMQWINEAIFTRSTEKSGVFNIGANVNSDAGKFPSNISAKRTLFAFFASYRLKLLNSIFLYSNVRQGMADSKLFPLTFSVGFETRRFHHFSFKGNFSRNYRIPTYNDLFYPGSGNTDLKSEDGLNSEITAIVELKNSRMQTKAEITAFNNRIDNLIIWQPINAVIWNPYNIGKVWARGIENVASLKWAQRNWMAQASVNYAYTRSTNEKFDPQAGETYKKQLIYIPRHKGSGFITIAFKQFGVMYSHQYSGLRYYEKDNSKFVKSYQTGNLSFFTDLKYVKHNFGLSFTINNVWDKSYEVVRRYPMPPRNYQLSLQISLINNKIR